MLLLKFNAPTKFYYLVDTVLDRDKTIHYPIFKFFNFSRDSITQIL